MAGGSAGIYAFSANDDKKPGDDESKVEEAKIALRKARDDARKDIKAAGLNEDAQKRAEKEVDDMIKDFNTEIDKLFAEKEAEIMKI